MKFLDSSIIVLAINMSAAGLAKADITVFSTNFDSAIPAEFSGAGLADGIQGFAGYGNPGNEFTGNFLRNTSTGNPATASVLTLTGLPTHTHVDVNFLLAILESWDGGGSVGGAAPDLFNVRVDGVTVFQESFETTNVSAQSYIPPAGVELVHKVQLGNWGHSFPESGYDMGLDPVFNNIVHSSDTLAVEWFASGSGWQGGNDESWAIDNVSITLLGTVAPGDYNFDGSVDAADYVVWRKNQGTPQEYEDWRSHFGQTAGSGATSSFNAAVPEPSSALLLILAAAVASTRRRQIAR